MGNIVGIQRRIYFNSPASSSSKRVLQLFEQLLTVAEKRGKDTTGAVLVNTKSTQGFTYGYNNTTSLNKRPGVYILKDYLSAHDFIKDKKYKQFISNFGSNSNLLIGHTKTVYKNIRDNKNNNPYVVGDIVGVHAGIIENWEELAAKHSLILEGTSDSEIIFALINMYTKKGNTITEAIKKTTTELKGTFACALIAKNETNTLFLFRRDAPLAIKHSKAQAAQILIFSSSLDDLIKAFILSKYRQDKHTQYYIEACDYLLPNNHGVVFKSKEDGYDTWVTSVTPFILS